MAASKSQRNKKSGNGSRHDFISVDDHVQEHPEVWTKRLSKNKWGDRIPRVERQADGAERWVVDGNMVSSQGVSAGIDMALWLIGQIDSIDHARAVQHYIQYDPAPPYQK